MFGADEKSCLTSRRVDGSRRKVKLDPDVGDLILRIDRSVKEEQEGRVS
jgi:hypothetical protein